MVARVVKAPLRSLMVLGTASNVGKSIIATAFCRIFAQDGYRVAPFKAQNMSLNSAATPDGYEIGRAQALQAEAAGIAPSADMNPVLIKPSSDTFAQIVVNGTIWANVSAHDFFRNRVRELFPDALAAYRRLANRHDVIVLEGAGSPAEINLREADIVNMRMAEAADAACVLVGDIERGGVFAALYGTLELLRPEERARIRGFVINKFRGDPAILEPGLRMIEEKMGIPCFGVIPHLPDIALEDEDSLALQKFRAKKAFASAASADSERPLRVAVVALPSMANFTDFDALAAEPVIDLLYVDAPEALERADVAIVPGTKQTLADLRWLRETGIAGALTRSAGRMPIIGICGGMQMLGRTIEDPDGVEGGGRSDGLALLPIRTRLACHKVTRPSAGTLVARQLFGESIAFGDVRGYEIHVGQTEYERSAPLLSLTRNGEGPAIGDGAVSDDGWTIGTYLHGFFDGDELRHAFIEALRRACGLGSLRERRFVARERADRIDRLAAHVRASLDMKAIMAHLEPIAVA